MNPHIEHQRAERLFHSPLSLGVVIPCHNNSWQLSGILKSLAWQTTGPDVVVVVDDNSNPWHERRLRSLCRRHGAIYKRLSAPLNELEILGRRSHARNVGTKCLSTDLVLYIDGDMLLCPEYVQEIKYYHSVLEGIYIRGQRYSISATQQAKGMEHCLAEVRSPQGQTQTVSLGYVTRPSDFNGAKVHLAAHLDKWEWCASNNLSLRRVHAVEIGYWDENFFGWGEEDIDFSYRLYRLGLAPMNLASVNAGAYHLEHPINHESNKVSLEKNGKYLLTKFPEVANHRRDAYAVFDIDLDDFT